MGPLPSVSAWLRGRFIFPINAVIKIAAWNIYQYYEHRAKYQINKSTSSRDVADFYMKEDRGRVEMRRFIRRCIILYFSMSDVIILVVFTMRHAYKCSTWNLEHRVLVSRGSVPSFSYVSAAWLIDWPYLILLLYFHVCHHRHTMWLPLPSLIRFCLVCSHMKLLTSGLTFWNDRGGMRLELNQVKLLWCWPSFSILSPSSVTTSCLLLLPFWWDTVGWVYITSLCGLVLR